MYSIKGRQNNKNHAFPLKRCISNEKSVIVTHFTIIIICTYLYITCNKKILFVKKYLSLLCIHRLLHSSCCFLNTNIAKTRQLIQTVRTLAAEWWQVAGNRGYGAKEDESSIRRIWAAGFHHVTAPSCLACILKRMNCLFLEFSKSFSGRGKPQILNLWKQGSACIFIILL